jgi:hypothetical protein
MLHDTCPNDIQYDYTRQNCVFVTLSISGIQHYQHSAQQHSAIMLCVIMLSVACSYFFAECHNAVCHGTFYKLQRKILTTAKLSEFDLII